jgi:triacylglycerol lipase
MVRDTELRIEWLDDVRIGADGITLDNCVKAEAWTGFYSIYNSMMLVRDGSRMLAAEGIAKAVGGATITVVGHSLGAALATYLTYDLARPDIGKLGNNVSGWFFASPKPANRVFADRFATVVSMYSVVNWQRDLVPTLPPHPLVPLNNINNSVLILTPANTVTQPKDTPTCNHHAICYAQMLDPAVARDTHYGCFGAPVTT